MSLGKNVDSSGFSDDGVGVGWEISRAEQRGEEGEVSRLLSLVFCLEGKKRKLGVMRKMKQCGAPYKCLCRQGKHIVKSRFWAIGCTGSDR
jgi:hypothetical protein